MTILREESPEAGIWGVRNYHTTLEQRARAGAQLTGGYFSMVIAAAVLATAGLLLNSPAVVIGSMCVAPFMAPSRAVCLGTIFRNRKFVVGGLLKQVVGLLVLGSGIACVMTVLLDQAVDGIEMTPEIMLRAMPTTRDVVLSAIIAVAAGGAASLALVAQPQVVESPWGQVIDAIIGVEIAISLIPPAAVIGIGLALGVPNHSVNAFYLLLLNVVGLNVVGSMSILALRGISRRHLEVEKQIRAAVEKTLDVVPGFVSIGSSLDITLFNTSEARVEIVLRRRFGGEAPSTLAESVADHVLETTGCRTDVLVEVIPVITTSNRESAELLAS